MGAGLPVAASSVGGVPEEVTDGVNGILFPPADSEKLASLLVELAADENKMRSLSAQGRKTVKEKFSMRRNIMLFEDVYSKLKTIP
jgi:glycosyltransferase involved in cell wall biosynthesis